MPTKYTTVSVKIPVEVKEILEKKGKKPGKIAKEAIMKAVEEIEIEEIEKSLAEVRNSLKKIQIDRIVEGIREDRRR